MPRRRWRALLALAVVVLAAHLLLLRGTPGAVQVPDAFGSRTWIMRTIAAQPPAAPLPVPATPPATRERPTAVSRAPAPRVAAPAPTAPPTTEPAAGPAAQSVTPTAGPAVAFSIPGSVRLNYQVTAQRRSQIWQASGELHWRHDGRDYDAKLELRAPLLPTRTQRSTGSLTAEGLAPQRFSDKGRSEEATHFERDTGKVSFSSNHPAAPLMAGAQDRLSVLLQLGAMIAGAPKRFPQGTMIGIQTAGTRDAETWLFKVEGEESLQLPGGNLNTLKLTRNPRKEFDQKVELWLAPSMDYMPVRLRLTQPNGDWVDQQWASTDRG